MGRTVTEGPALLQQGLTRIESDLLPVFMVTMAVFSYRGSTTV